MRTVRWALSLLLCSFMIAGTTLPVAAAARPSSTLGALTQIEVWLYGEASTGSLIERIRTIEEDLYGEVQEGALLPRIQRAKTSLVTGGAAGTTSLKLKLNAAEWMIFQRLTEGEPLMERLDQMEMDVFGQVSSGSVAERVNALVSLVWPPGDFDGRRVEIPPETLVKIRVLDGWDSAEAQVGDRVTYRIVEDVLIDDRLVIGSGTEGIGRVSEVQEAGRMGRDGRVAVDFGTISALDGTHVQLTIASKATESNSSLKGAAAASMAGVLLLGPVGLVGGYFVNGEDVQVAAGTEFFVEVAERVEVTGISL